MALSRPSILRRWLPGGPAKPVGLAPAALAVCLLAGCAGGSQTDAPTAVAGDARIAPTPKPLAPSAEAGVTMPASPDAVPTLSGKVRYGAPAAAVEGVGATLSGAVPFPPSDAWNRDVVARAVDASTPALIGAIGPEATLKAGFDARSGVQYAVVGAGQPRVPVTVAGEPTGRAWPLPASLEPSSDPLGRVSVIDREAGVLYELHGAARSADGTWTATAAAAWRLDAADAAPFDAAGPTPGGGMPVLAGLVRRDEAEAGVIRHALRITVPTLRAAWVAPARGAVGGADDAVLPPLGARLRLRADLRIPADASREARAILQALQSYGAIVVGTGPALALEGAPDPGWESDALAVELARIRAVDFEVVAPEGPEALAAVAR
jgi:hypothetical protein